MISEVPRTVVWRHRKENLKKCSLRGLEARTDFQFVTYPYDDLPELTGYIELSMDGPSLCLADAGHGLFLIDATWRYAALMQRQLIAPRPNLLLRSIPSCFRTAYPRRQSDCPDPETGLASIEALYIAYVLIGRNPIGLLDGYHWKDNFLQVNAEAFDSFEHCQNKCLKTN